MNFMLAMFRLLPVIVSSVQAVEAAIPVQNAGRTKLDLILGMVTDIYGADSAMEKDLPKDRMTSIVTATVARVVSTFNALGVFSTVKK